MNVGNVEGGSGGADESCREQGCCRDRKAGLDMLLVRVSTRLDVFRYTVACQEGQTRLGSHSAGCLEGGRWYFLLVADAYF